MRPLPWTARRDAACLALGLACLVLPLVWPRYLFALTWAWAVLLLEPWNRRHARRSYLRDLEQGQAGPLVQALLAGLVCGVLWEAWNYWARTKWIYTVPFFEELKLFEMPLLGFLGFPPFAVECVVVVRFLQALGQRWRPPMAVKAVAWAAAAVGVAACFAAVEPVTVDSYYVPVRRLAVLEPEVRGRLADLGLESPEKLARALDSTEERRRWSERTGLSVAELERAHEAAALVLHQGLGGDRALELRALGIDSVAALCRWRAEDLAAALRAGGVEPRDRFLERRARVWTGH